MDLVVVQQKVFEREVKDYRLGTGQLWAWLGRGKFPPDQMCSHDEKVTGHQQKKFSTSF